MIKYVTTNCVRNPFVVFSIVRLSIKCRALLLSKAGRIIRTHNIFVAHLISFSFTYTKRSSIRWLWILALATLHCDATSTGSCAIRPRTPITPAAIHRRWLILDGHTFSILTPLGITKKYANINTAIFHKFL